LATVAQELFGDVNHWTIENKKTDVAEHPKAFGHVGLLFNEPPGKARLFFV
jgi:hypothetical protein